jgi:hypothetical protein
MSTNWITVAKLAGPVVRLFEEKFAAWRSELVEKSLRLTYKDLGGKKFVVESTKYLESGQDGPIVSDMLRLSREIESHADRPPVVYFRKYLDPWSSGPGFFFTADWEMGEFKDDAYRVPSSRITLAFLRLTKRSRLREELADELRLIRRRRAVGDVEWRWYLRALRECVAAREPFLESHGLETALVLSFETMGGYWDDEEVIRESSGFPAWLDWLKGEPPRRGVDASTVDGAREVAPEDHGPGGPDRIRILIGRAWPPIPPRSEPPWSQEPWEEARRFHLGETVALRIVNEGSRAISYRRLVKKVFREAGAELFCGEDVTIERFDEGRWSGAIIRTIDGPEDRLFGMWELGPGSTTDRRWFLGRTVRPGSYRAVLRYQPEDGEARPCGPSATIISPTFEVLP